MVARISSAWVVSLYEMATGVSPFRSDSTIATLRRIVDDKPAAIASLAPELPPWFSYIVERLLSKDPAQRFTSANEVALLLEQCLSHLQQPASVPLPASLLPHANARRSIFNSNNKGILTMLGTLGTALLGMVLWQATEAPDISGQWTSDEWGTVVLESTEPGRYVGTLTNAFFALGTGRHAHPKWQGANCASCHEGATGKIELKWARLENRFNGTWSHPENQTGKLSLRLVEGEIRGAWTVSKKSEANPWYSATGRFDLETNS
jgi:serine/threonine protein kinase